MKRFLIILLTMMFLWLQYRLWWGDGSVSQREQLAEDISHIQLKLEKDHSRNAALRKDIDNLKYRNEALEELAREKLGLIKTHEHFFRILPSSKSKTSTDD